MKKVLIVAWVALLLLAGCVSHSGPRDTLIGSPKTIDIPVSGDSHVEVRIPVGEVLIEGVDGDRLQAEMIIRCAAADQSCARRLSDVALVTSIEGRNIIIRSSKNASITYRDADVVTRVMIPIVQSVNVDMTAGELTVSRLTGCLTVDMGAGDIEVDLDRSQVASVHLDAGVGDASMAVAGQHREARRRMLIGAEMDWDAGSGSCRIDVDLQAGDIFVELTDG